MKMGSWVGIKGIVVELLRSFEYNVNATNDCFNIILGNVRW